MWHLGTWFSDGLRSAGLMPVNDCRYNFQPKRFCAGVAGATLPTVGDKTSLGPHWQVHPASAGESLLWSYPTLTDVLSPVIHILGALEIEH